LSGARKATRDSAGEQLQQAQGRVAKSLQAANRSLKRTAAEATERVQYATGRARKEAEAHPWAAIGLAAAAGMAPGPLLRRK
jgi:ElaB/YqjD/DUF883 family membrane-anchored ribosome-binding protein